jgi:hypothetical protein
MKPLISCCFSFFVHLQHTFRQEGEKVVDHIRPLLFGDEVARHVFGQAGACGNVAYILVFRDLGLGVPLAFFPSTCFRVRYRAR